MTSDNRNGKKRGNKLEVCGYRGKGGHELQQDGRRKPASCQILLALKELTSGAVKIEEMFNLLFLTTRTEQTDYLRFETGRFFKENHCCVVLAKIFSVNMIIPSRNVKRNVVYVWRNIISYRTLTIRVKILIFFQTAYMVTKFQNGLQRLYFHAKPVI